MIKRVASVLIALSMLTGILAADSSTTPQEKKGFRLFDSIFNRNKQPAADPASASELLSSLDTNQITAGLKQALEKGLQSAVAQLGRTNGFLTNSLVRIPLPDQLQTVARTLRALGQDAMVDNFEMTMNRAAEQAVPAATDVFVQSLKEMSIQDATSLLTSESPTAVTEYFKRTTTPELTERFLPIVKQATAAAELTAGYKQLVGAARARLPFLPASSLDIDQYVTGKSLDGLFTMVAQEEKRIRENPQARTTELLQKVFGAIRRQK